MRHPEAVGGQYAREVVGVGGGEGGGELAPFVAFDTRDVLEVGWDVL